MAAEQLSPEIGQRWIDLAAHPLPDFEDLRHDSDHTRPTGDNTALLLDATLEATDIVIASPLYWYSVSASTKRYLDYWSGWLRTPGVDFKASLQGRTLWGVTALAHEEQVVADPLVGTLRNSAAYMGMLPHCLKGVGGTPRRSPARQRQQARRRTQGRGGTAAGQDVLRARASAGDRTLPVRGVAVRKYGARSSAPVRGVVARQSATP
ncbi:MULTISPECIES: flavodoxin family protein [unclassified Streptomyces]|uniref:flavodoxin family protein n=1 Tax=unclassified Streptomyces TaxID=2593676 RepID=UPI0036EAC7FB